MGKISLRAQNLNQREVDRLGIGIALNSLPQRALRFGQSALQAVEIRQVDVGILGAGFYLDGFEQILFCLGILLQSNLRQGKIVVAGSFVGFELGQLGEDLSRFLGAAHAGQRRSLELIASGVLGIFFQDGSGLFACFFILARPQIKAAYLQASVGASRLQIDGLLQVLESVLPLLLGQVCFRQLVISLGVTGVEFQGVAELDGCFLGLALLQVSLATFDKFLLGHLGIFTATKDYKCQHGC